MKNLERIDEGEIIQSARAEPCAKNGDYWGADGLLYCGICHTPKELDLSTLGVDGGGIVCCLCSCSAAERDANERKKSTETFSQRRTDWMSGFEHMTLENSCFDNAGVRTARRIVTKLPSFLHGGHGLYLTGGTGRGKSFAAACIANAAVDSGYMATMLSVTSAVDLLTDRTERKNFLNRLRKFDLVVLDDLGAERSGAFTQEKIFELVDVRISSNKSTIITSNLEVSDTRLRSRLATLTRINVEGDDLRVNAGQTKKEALSRLLRA